MYEDGGNGWDHRHCPAQSLHQAKSKHQTIKCKINNTGFYESTNNAKTLFGVLKHWQNERMNHTHSIFNMCTTQAYRF